ncbi:tyrosine phosphatase family-domain-containing protein [Hypoxylon trugodes]|uniref:tyrosine phosphatase family-domain-containing protein n=1 Tax=Hypoxylon trugodes TaxID=326681 RepID=UPI0021953CED|nr:tyrosine phosphatase family-domain-containing protein [Hypoxylon trugodes]KAI1389235.1 tyrosine phosphatase family-domain-containing protein [Hypoxylon trugodes]
MYSKTVGFSEDIKVNEMIEKEQQHPHPHYHRYHHHHQLSHTINMKLQSPEDVLREAYISAKDIAVEQSFSHIGSPPINFATVLPGLYRSGYPQTSDYPFMQTLDLKTIVTLVGKELPDGFQQFIDENGIKHQIFDMAGTKKAEIPIETMQSIISIISNRKNYPLLIHCNHGKHRTGCVVGVLRKTNEWDTTSIIREYTKYAEPKVRETDVKYLLDFKLADLPNVISRPSRAPFVVRTFYGMIMLASFTISIWVYSSTRLLLLTTV